MVNVRFIGIYLAIVLLAFGATYFFLRSDWGSSIVTFVMSDESRVAQLLQANPCSGEKDSSFSCWNSYYENLIQTYGPRVALLELKGRYEAGGYPRLFCHTLLHPIGEAAGTKYGSVAEAYKYGDPFCRSGYYHGVLEGIFGEEGGDDLLASLDSLCAEVNGKERYSYDYFACVHGVGHGLMSFFDHDIFQSLSGCDLLTGDWEQSSCYGGVFMENIVSNTPEEPSKYLKENDLLYPCNAIAGKYQEECYQMQTSHMLAKLDGDFAKTFKLCASIEEQNRIFCYQSIGRDASGWSYGSAETALLFCMQGATVEQRTECIVGAAADFIQSTSADAAREVCARVPQESRERCSTNVESQIQML